MLAGPTELGIVLVIAVFLFGAKRIPKVANALGESVAELSNARRRAESVGNDD